MVKHKELMNLREEEIGKILGILTKYTDDFEKPKLILIGGYALRAFASFSRYTRDCDFVMIKADGWNLDEIQRLVAKEMNTETFEKHESYGFLRCVKLIGASAKISIDFMEGEVRGRTDEQIFRITEKFLQKAKKVNITIADRTIEMYVPDYTDYLILKLMSARPSDIRDIATLVWKNGLPKDLKKTAKEALVYPEIIVKNLAIILKDISDKRFLDSWKGTFVTTEFTEKSKEEVLKKLKALL